MYVVVVVRTWDEVGTVFAINSNNDVRIIIILVVHLLLILVTVWLDG